MGESLRRWLQGETWWYRLPAEVREPPGLYLCLAAIALLVLLIAWRLIAGRWGWRSAAERSLRRRARGLELRGDHRAAGELLADGGRPRAALAAFRRGGHAAAAADLLRRLGRLAEAREEARAGSVWGLYAELSAEADEPAEAAAAYEKAGLPAAAAGAWHAAGDLVAAARCALAGGHPARALALLTEADGPAVAPVLDAAVRAALPTARSAGGTVVADVARGAARGVQAWLDAGEPERGYRLAVDAELVELAAPIARDHLPPSAETAELCVRAGQSLAAAEIYSRLGDERREALLRAEHFDERGETVVAADWLERAEDWEGAAERRAAVGEVVRSAELYAKAGAYALAATQYRAAGQEDRAAEMDARAAAADPRQALAPSFGSAPTEPSPRRGSRPAPPALAGLGPDERYVPHEEIGRGGMGRVYRAEDRVLGREVALKVLPHELLGSHGEAEALLAEARAAARLSHPNIVQVHDVGQGEQGFFIVMELAIGETFAALIVRRQLTPRGVLVVGRQVCAALDHAHQRRIIHRDLKPGNLLWADEKRVKLMDFGLARLLADPLGKVATRPAGTPSYMSPEQIQGLAVDPRTDLYSLGCVLFELLTREAPFPGGATIHHHLNSQPVDPRSLRPELPAALAELVLRCLAKDPRQRPTSAREVGAALKTLMAEVQESGG